MKLISWNVNGLRACMGKGFLEFFKEVDADMFCIQETKMQPGQLELELEGYHQYWCSAQKKGYSGTALFCKQEPISVQYELPQEIHASEGRVIAAEFERFYLVNVYTPNSQRGLTRLDYGMGGCLFDIYPAAGREKAGDHLRGYECGASGDRSEKSQNKRGKCGFHPAGAGKNDGASAGRLFG